MTSKEDVKNRQQSKRILLLLLLASKMTMGALSKSKRLIVSPHVSQNMEVRMEGFQYMEELISLGVLYLPEHG